MLLLTILCILSTWWIGRCLQLISIAPLLSPASSPCRSTSRGKIGTESCQIRQTASPKVTLRKRRSFVPLLSFFLLRFRFSRSAPPRIGARSENQTFAIARHGRRSRTCTPSLSPFFSFLFFSVDDLNFLTSGRDTSDTGDSSNTVERFHCFAESRDDKAGKRDCARN